MSVSGHRTLTCALAETDTQLAHYVNVSGRLAKTVFSHYHSVNSSHQTQLETLFFRMDFDELFGV
jgi:hypothetical protein